MQILMNKIGELEISPEKVLSNVVKSWVAIGLTGQWLFAAYIFAIYALPLLVGNPELSYEVSPARGVASKNSVDLMIFFAHILPAVLMALSGLFQLFPSIRKKYPKFHRYNGRMFFTLGISGALTGLYLTWGAGLRFTDIGALGVTLNGILIPIAIYFAWTSAVNKDFRNHQRFAIHSFILVNGVWSFRLYLMGWFLINQGPNGNSSNLDGPADLTISFACYLLPMAIAELIFWVQRKRNTRLTWLASVVAALGALITLIGVVAATMMMWSPRISMVLNGL